MTLRRFKLSLIATAIVTLAGVAAERVRSEALVAAGPIPESTVAAPVSGKPAESELIRDAVLPAAASKNAQAGRRLWMEVTAYCPCTKCCGPQAQGLTASGLPVSHNQGRFVAADTSVLPFGARISIPGYHASTHVPVIDRGGAIKGQKIDVFFPTHEEALQWGRRWLMVAVAE